MRCSRPFCDFELRVGLDTLHDHHRRNAGSEPDQMMEEVFPAAADEECVQFHDID